MSEPEMDPKTLNEVADWLEGRYEEVTPSLLRTIAIGLEAARARDEAAGKETPTCPDCGGPAVTHYGVLFFSGDPFGEHPDPELRGQAPGMMSIAGGDEQFCWDALAEWTAKHPLRLFESAEVLARTVF